MRISPSSRPSLGRRALAFKLVVALLIGAAGVLAPVPRWTVQSAMATETRRPLAEGAAVQPAPSEPPAAAEPDDRTDPADPAATSVPRAADTTSPPGPEVPPGGSTTVAPPVAPSTAGSPPPAPPTGEPRVRVAEDTRDFSLIGVTLPDPPTAPVLVRTGAGDGEWSAWHPLEFDTAEALPPVPGAPVPQEPDEEAPGEHSEPLWVDDATGYELDLSAGDAASAEVHLVYETSEEVAVAETAPAGADPRGPRINPRSSWGARPPSATPSIASSLKLGVVHHTAGTSEYSDADVPALLRGVQAYHMDANGWSDIGYNFAVDRFGRVWEARAGGVTRAVIGAHARGFNTGSTGVVVLGNFESAWPSSAAVDAVASTLAWKFAVHDVDPRGSVAFRAGEGSTVYPPGSVVTLNRIIGHRDVGQTACPGRNLYPYLDPIRASVGNAWPHLAAPGIARVGNFAADRSDDVFLRQPGVLPDLLLTASAASFTPRRNFTVNGTYRPLVGDFDGNGYDDLFWYAPGTARDAVWYSRGDLSFSTVVSGQVYGSYRPFAGDFDGDGDDDVFWYAPGGGADYLWRAEGTQFHSARTTPVNGDYRTAAGDFDGDGDDDILWHGPRSVPDYLWESRNGSFRGHATLPVSGSYHLAAGDYDGDRDDDVLFYAPGPASDYLWISRSLAFTSRSARRASGVYQYVRAADINGDGRDEVLWYASPGTDFLWVHGPGILDVTWTTNVPLR